MKATAIAPSNIAFIKYWGRTDTGGLRLPANGSISMNLSGMTTTTTVEFDPSYSDDSITIDGAEDSGESARVTEHLDRIRATAETHYRARVVSRNGFPSGTGLSSSASGFAALTVAACSAIGLSLPERELSVLARRGSGSACRSIPDGFVEWHAADTTAGSFSESLFPPDYWDICDIVAIVSSEKKDVPTTKGMQQAATSLFYLTRLNHIPEKIVRIKDMIARKDFKHFGELVESEALEMHAVMMTQIPPLMYWSVGTLQLMKAVRKWRCDGIPAYVSVNTGQDVHVITEKTNAADVAARIRQEPYVKDLIINMPARGARTVDTHLF